MSEPYVGEIRSVGFNFAPVGWALCNGQLMAISQNVALYQLIGTTYGGDGVNTFALPNMMSRAPVHVGIGFALGQMGGAETVTLNLDQVPPHNHVVNANTGQGNSVSPVLNYPAGGDRKQFAPTDGSFLDGTSVAQAGGDQPHDNVQPYVAVTFIIALFGVFPTQS